MVLLLALAGGLPAGLVWSRWRRQAYRPPELGAIWLACVSFAPQVAALYLPYTLAAACLLISMLAFLAFAWINRELVGMQILLVGLLLNLVVMMSNSGFMPISPQTAAHLVAADTLRDVGPGERIGRKDILLVADQTRFEWLADRFLTPSGLPFRSAFSLGDVLIAAGAFLILLLPQGPSHHKD